jgi:hypothetical protein
MKTRTIALLICLLTACSLTATITLAQSNDQQNKEEEASPATQVKFAVKLFEIKHRQPHSLRESLQALGSGTKGSSIIANNQLRTLTVRDFPENIAAIEDALKRLDVPEQSPVSLEFQIHLLSASMNGSGKTELPKNLEPVVAQLKATLKFTNYRYVSSALNRASNGGKIESSGVTGSLFPTPTGVTNTAENPSFYQYTLTHIMLAQDASGKETVLIDLFKFGVGVPIKINPGQTQYRDIGIVTPLSLREGEMAVVGTANIGGSDEAIIVVVSVKKVR